MTQILDQNIDMNKIKINNNKYELVWDVMCAVIGKFHKKVFLFFKKGFSKGVVLWFGPFLRCLYPSPIRTNFSKAWTFQYRIQCYYFRVILYLTKFFLFNLPVFYCNIANTEIKWNWNTSHYCINNSR